MRCVFLAGFVFSYAGRLSVVQQGDKSIDLLLNEMREFIGAILVEDARAVAKMTNSAEKVIENITEVLTNNISNTEAESKLMKTAEEKVKLLEAKTGKEMSTAIKTLFREIFQGGKHDEKEGKHTSAPQDKTATTSKTSLADGGEAKKSKGSLIQPLVEIGTYIIDQFDGSGEAQSAGEVKKDALMIIGKAINSTEKLTKTLKKAREDVKQGERDKRTAEAEDKFIEKTLTKDLILKVEDSKEGEGTKEREQNK